MKKQEFTTDQKEEILSIISDFLMWDDLDKVKDFLFELQNTVLYNTVENNYTEEEANRITGNFSALYGLMAQLKKLQNSASNFQQVPVKGHLTYTLKQKNIEHN